MANITRCPVCERGPGRWDGAECRGLPGIAEHAPVRWVDVEVVPASALEGAVEALDAAIGEGQCAEGHAWTDGFVVHCELCAKVARLVNRTGGR